MVDPDGVKFFCWELLAPGHSFQLRKNIWVVSVGEFEYLRNYLKIRGVE